MQALRYGTLVFCVVIGLAVLALVVHIFWLASQNDPPLFGQKVQDLQLLVVILLGLTGLYTVVFLLSPNMSERILKRQAQETVDAVRDHVSMAARDFRDLKEEIRQTVLGQLKAIREDRAEIVAAPRAALEAPQSGAPSGAMSGREYLHLSSRLRILNNELVQIYQALAALALPNDENTARAYLAQALNLTSDPATAAEIHYELACLLARGGELGEAVIELQTAFVSKSPELERKLTKDTEEGGPLYALTASEPYDSVMDDLLMDVSVGS